MPLVSFEALFQAVDSRRPMTPLAAAGGADATVLEALRIASGRGWIAPQVVGVEAEVRRVARDCGIALDGFTLVDAADAAGAGRLRR
jgi:phosphate butyryltransferase